jgi:hypothetical protein
MANIVDMASEQSLTSAFEDQLEAMKQGDTTRLAGLLDDGFTLTHITGYRQAKLEWLAQMRAGQFRYHAISVRGINVVTQGETASLTARIITDATVYGTRADWRLQLDLQYERRTARWIALSSVANTW